MTKIGSLLLAVMASRSATGGHVRRWPGLAARIRADWKRSGLGATALGAIGFSLGIAVAMVGVGETPQSAAFAKTAGFSVWSAITGFEVALWAICWTKANGIGHEIRSQNSGS